MAVLLSACVLAGGRAGAAKTEADASQVMTAEPLVVSVTRMDVPFDEVAGSVQVITREELEARQVKNAGDALRGLAGLDVNRSGGAGKVTDIYSRGTNSNHTLILIDGVEMNDPMTVGRSYDFAQLTADNIERIEYLEGPQSTLYGSDAMGGVVNIVTRKGTAEKHLSAGLEGGSFGTFIQSLQMSGAQKWVNLALGVSHTKTNGISAASGRGNDEKDGNENTNISAHLGIDPSKTFSTEFMVRNIDSKTDLDNGAGPDMDDPNHSARSDQTFFRSQAKLRLFDGLWNHKAGFSYSEHDNVTTNEADPAHLLDSSRSQFRGKVYTYDWESVVRIAEIDHLQVGVEHQEEKGDSESVSDGAFGPFSSVFSEERTGVTSYFAQNQIRLFDATTLSLGGRLDDHRSFGNRKTFRAAASHEVKASGTKVKSSYGTGFKAPSLFQLYSSFGNRDLGAEKSEGWDAGLEQTLFDGRSSIGGLYFANHLDNMIDFDNVTFKYKNTAEAETEGAEFFISARPADKLFTRFKYTYMETKDATTREPLIRRARSKFGADVNMSVTPELNTHVNVNYVGPRDDLDFSAFPPARTELKGYTVTNLGVSYRPLKYLELTGRAENVFNTQYEEILGFGSPGVSGFVGAKFIY
ncbi:MAG: hypothetical protein A3A86_02725 [Elusimicrobia bacterium RIFCSPLOWO2_01_FULL_60_11]|nr:MAG: hypothetical protein A3A86_02725 [Elusimicrobia bacterium RIFCSPLOWO2_01_FULL_60_11]